MKELDIAFQGTIAYGGVGRFTAELTRALANRGHNVTIFTTPMSAIDYESHDWFENLPKNINVVENRGFLQNSIRDLWSFSNYDVIHLNYASLSWTALPAHISGVPTVLTVHGSLKISFENRSLKRRLKYLFERSSLRLLSNIYSLTTVSEYNKDIIAERLNVVPEYVYHGPPNFNKSKSNRMKKDLDLGSDGIKLLTVGRFYESKDIMSAVKALEILNENRCEEIELDIVGGGKDNQGVRKYIRENNLKSVYIYEDISDDTMGAIFKSADVFLLPSYSETFGIVLLEAMQYHLPIVCVNEGSSSEIVGDAGIVAEARSPKSIADAVNRIISSPEVYQELVDRSQDRLKQFSWKDAAKRYEKIYSSIN